MLLKRGPRLPVAYFLNAHLFDLQHGTDTHAWVPKEQYEERPQNFEGGVLYMTSWTSEIGEVFNALRQLKILSEPYTFLDVGCGKGKVCIAWRLLESNEAKRANRIIGIDYYDQFIELARRNFRAVFKSEGDFRLADATAFDFTALDDRLIVYLYNPFDESIMKQMLEHLPANTVVIYNNPVHASLFREPEFRVLHRRHGWHPNAQTTIFLKTKPA